MEVQQCTELTRTNRSCGLTTYFFRTLELVELYRRRQQALLPRGSPAVAHLLRGAPGEGLSHRIDRLPTGGLLTENLDFAVHDPRSPERPSD